MGIRLVRIAVITDRALLAEQRVITFGGAEVGGRGRGVDGVNVVRARAGWSGILSAFKYKKNSKKNGDNDGALDGDRKWDLQIYRCNSPWREN